jgi:hypothetical protein
MDEVVAVTPEIIRSLTALRQEVKFFQEGLYPGAPNETIRSESEAKVNSMIDRICAGLAATPHKRFVLAEFKIMLGQFDADDTEEREHACAYCERVMDIMGIRSADGILGAWLYGSDEPGEEA